MLCRIVIAVFLLATGATVADPVADGAEPSHGPPAAGAAGAGAAGAPPVAAAPAIGATEGQGLFRHTARYPPLVLAWRADPRIAGVTAVFPHPVLHRRVVVATADGLLASDDAGQTWTPLPAAASDKVGRIRHVAFSMQMLDAFYAASDRGVWASDDFGKTLRPAGDRRLGMASDHAAAVYIFPGDRREQTLLVAHGDAAPGLSVTADGGRSWRVVAADYFVREVLCGGIGDQEFFVVGAKKNAPDVTSIYYCPGIDDFWIEVVRDLVPTGGATSVLVRPERWTEEVFDGLEPWFATADGGLYRVSQGAGWRVGPPTLTSVASVGVTWGPNADTQIVYAYEPRRLGLVISTDNMKTAAAASVGLYTGDYVKQGAHVRANSSGTVFYAAINDALFVGRKQPGRTAVLEATVAPAVFTFGEGGYRAAMEDLRESLRSLPQSRSAAADARLLVSKIRQAQAFLSQTRLTVTARVTTSGGPPASVTADLSRLGGSPLTPMFDDGRHGDGQAGDGLWGTVFRLDPRRLKTDSKDWRRRWPGRMAITVTAVATDGSIDGQVAVLAVADRRESFVVTHRSEPIAVSGGPWSKSFGIGYASHRDVTDYWGLVFWIMTDLADDEDVRVELRDSPVFAVPVTTPPVSIVREGLVEGGRICGEWRKVTIPLARLLRDSPDFRTSRLGAVVLSGQTRAAGTYWVEGMRLVITEEEAKASGRAKTR